MEIETPPPKEDLKLVIEEMEARLASNEIHGDLTPAEALKLEHDLFAAKLFLADMTAKELDEVWPVV